jgi:hypothetical protein
MAMNGIKRAAALLLTVLMVGCASKPVTPYDFTAFKAEKPRSILVLPPLNNSPDVNASNSVLSHATYPLAESGYYVYPVALVNETFKQNGLVNPAEIHEVKPEKLAKIFGADTALYITVSEYGSTYKLIRTDIKVVVQGRLVSLKTGKELWAGSAWAVNNGSVQINPVAALVNAAVDQILNSLTDKTHVIAGNASRFMLHGVRNAGITGPYLVEVEQTKP